MERAVIEFALVKAGFHYEEIQRMSHDKVMIFFIMNDEYCKEAQK